MAENKSEIARLREQIELECEAMRCAMDAPRVVARHDIIAAHYHNLDQQRIELVGITGEEDAMTLITTLYNQIMR